MMRFSRVLMLGLLSLVVTFALSAIWEFSLERPFLAWMGWEQEFEDFSSHWGYVAAVMGLAAFAIGLLSLLSIGLMRELQAKDRVLRLKDEERTSFAADVAHELRTPLAVLRAHLDSLDGGDPNGQLSEDVDRITRIVEQVLAKSRIDSIEVQSGDKVDLAQISSSIAAYLAPLVIREGRSIEVVGAQNPVMINGNAFALEQALRNLVENAIKYSARGSTITVDVTDEPSIRVIDRGRGIPLHERELIFERFRRADRRSIGSGLGLSIVRRVADAHGGDISIEDAPGGGAVFTLRFPRN